MTRNMRMGLLKEIEEAMAGEHYQEALDSINSILELPEDVESAANKLQGFMADPETVKLTLLDTEKTSEGDHSARLRMDFGGGLIPHIMDLRGSCFVQILDALHKKQMESQNAFEEPGAMQLVSDALQQAQLTGMLFHDYPGPLFRAGMICYQCFQAKPASQFSSRVLELEPDHQGARELLKMAERAMQAEGQ